jgi:hypothetical protein
MYLSNRVGIDADLAHLVERHLAKVEVASSSLVIRSKKTVSFQRDTVFISIIKTLIFWK